jgi:5-methylcytosine-specific restriction protein A
VDHIVAIRGEADPLFYEPSNHSAKCGPCHSRKTVRQDGGFGRTPSREAIGGAKSLQPSASGPPRAFTRTKTAPVRTGAWYRRHF